MAAIRSKIYQKWQEREGRSSDGDGLSKLTQRS